jgi:hypothetical protein
MLDKRAVLLAKDEVTYNTDSVPVAGTDAVLIEDLAWSFANARMHQRNPVRASLGMLKPNFAGTLIQVSGKCEMKGSGSAGVAPEIAPLLKACGFAETVVGATSVTYKPSSSQSVHKSSSMYFYDDGLRLIMTGARGKVSFDFQVGKPAMAAFEFIGHFVSITDQALPAGTFDTTVPPMLVNMPFSVGAYSAVISKLALDMGVELAIPENIAATDGYGEIQIIGRKPTGSFNPLRVTIASKDFIADWRSGAALALDSGLIGATGGNRLQLTAPAITYAEVSRGNQNNVETYETKFQAAETAAGDDEVSLAFT